MISAYRPKFASPFPEADPAPFPFAPFDGLPLGGLSEEPSPLSGLWAVGEDRFFASFSSFFLVLEGDLCPGLSLGFDFGVLFSSGIDLAVGLALGLGLGLALGLGVGFGLGFGADEGLGFGVEEGVGLGVGFGVSKFDGEAGVT
jgi:hypothetical protein